MPGKNIAQIVHEDSVIKYVYQQNEERSKICFFISHKEEDMEAAKELGHHIMEDYGYNIYLDLFDQKLQKADTNNDAEGVVNAIQQGLLYSSHLLCVISERTKDSWWVPYEIGFAQASNVKTASIVLKESEYLPTFLRVRNSPVFLTMTELDHYLAHSGLYAALFSRKNTNQNDAKQYQFFNN